MAGRPLRRLRNALPSAYAKFIAERALSDGPRTEPTPGANVLRLSPRSWVEQRGGAYRLYLPGYAGGTAIVPANWLLLDKGFDPRSLLRLDPDIAERGAVVAPPPRLYHATYKQNVPFVEANGLSSRGAYGKGVWTATSPEQALLAMRLADNAQPEHLVVYEIDTAGISSARLEAPIALARVVDEIADFTGQDALRNAAKMLRQDAAEEGYLPTTRILSAVPRERLRLLSRRQNSSRLRVAHVGSYDLPEDHWQAIKVYDWLFAHLPTFVVEPPLEHDTINLDFGRDFLRESKAYDLVIVHHVWNAPPVRGRPQPGTFNVSSRHSRAAWRDRLVSTQARVIACVGDEDEVAGDYLGNLPGYKRVQEKGLTMYVRDSLR